MTPLLQVRALRLGFGATSVLDGLDLDVGAGEVVGLVGRSGAGKSLTALAILGLAPPTARVSGEVRLDRRPLQGLDERDWRAVRGRRIGLVLQDPSTALDPVMPIGEQVAEGLRVHRLASRAEAHRQALAMLARVGLGEVSPERRPHQLSGGQRQRVAIAAALVLKPRLLIADEPTAALDGLTRTAIADLLARLVREEAMAMLLFSHDLALMARLADRVAVLEDGRIAAQGPPSMLSRSMAEGETHAARPPPSVAPPGPPLVEAQDLSRSYAARRGGGRSPRVVGVDGASLTLRPGERLAIVGETGAGKSTLMRLLLGLERPDEGSVRLAGQAFSSATPRAQQTLRRRIQPVFQDPASSFDPRWTLARIVSEPLHLMRPPLSRQDSRERVGRALAQVDLAGVDTARRASSFSGGQRQRIALARALVLEPDVLVLDEATSALDPQTQAQVLALLDRLVAERSLACILVAHDLVLVRVFADAVMVLKDGRVVEAGPTAEVFATSRDPYTRALIDASPDLQAALATRAGVQSGSLRPAS